MEAYFTAEALTALFQVIMIDLVLAGDNAIVIGLAAAGLPQAQRAKVIFWGIAAATAMRIGFAGITIQLLQIIGLLLAGGILLLWVCWKMWRELRYAPSPRQRGRGRHRTFGAARYCGSCRRAAQDRAPGDLADRRCRHLDVARQRARRRGRLA